MSCVTVHVLNGCANFARKDGWEPLFTRGVPARPEESKILGDVIWFEADGSPRPQAAPGDVYTDGFAKGPYWRARRGGRVVVAFRPNGRWYWTRRVTIGGLNITSFRAELRALLEALKIAKPLV